MTKVDCRSEVGVLIEQDWTSGALRYDAERGSLHKASAHQEYLLTNQDRVVRYDNANERVSTYDEKLKVFLPTNALRDGEELDRTRVLSKTDILAKPTWGQFAGDAAVTVAQGVVAGTVIGAVGGAIAATVQHTPARSLWPSAPATSDAVGQVDLGLHRSALRVHTAALHAGPLHPGDLNPPTPPWPTVPPPPAPGPGFGRQFQEGMNEAAFGATFGIIGGAIGVVGGPAGIAAGNILGGLVGIGIGKLWNEIF